MLPPRSSFLASALVALVMSALAAGLLVAGSAPGRAVTSSSVSAPAPRECFSAAEYRQIKNGMTRRQVVRIIGTDADYYYKQGTKRVGQWMACRQGPYYVVFRIATGKVVDKSTGPCYRATAQRAARC